MVKWSKYRYAYDWHKNEMIACENVNVFGGLDISEFIAKNDLKIDEQYFNAVLCRNGGVIEKNFLKEIEITVNGKKQIIPSVFSVSRFLGFVDSAEENIAELYYKKYPDKKLLPIAADTKDDVFFLDCNKSGSGGVYFELTDESVLYFDGSLNPSDDFFEPRLNKIADTFTDFLNLIQWDEDQKVQPNRT
ncbi:MAG: SMI1/KNR4 family protein [Clostridiales bacterium]|jgi:hypothetical protein|nr:SMI1/KNR4 family protein [Clostridiales bacterium]